jgi:hypothetical protein
VSYTLAFALQLRKKAQKNLSQGSRRVPFGTIKTGYRDFDLCLTVHLQSRQFNKNQNQLDATNNSVY